MRTPRIERHHNGSATGSWLAATDGRRLRNPGPAQAVAMLTLLPAMLTIIVGSVVVTPHVPTPVTVLAALAVMVAVTGVVARTAARSKPLFNGPTYASKAFPLTYTERALQTILHAGPGTPISAPKDLYDMSDHAARLAVVRAELGVGVTPEGALAVEIAAAENRLEPVAARALAAARLSLPSRDGNALRALRN